MKTQVYTQSRTANRVPAFELSRIINTIVVMVGAKDSSLKAAACIWLTSADLVCRVGSRLAPFYVNQTNPVTSYDVSTIIIIITVHHSSDDNISSCQWNTPIFRPPRKRDPLNPTTSNLPWGRLRHNTSGTSPYMKTLVFLSLRERGGDGCVNSS